MANGNFGGGTGTSTDPYLVEDARDLLNCNKYDKYYKQVCDIDLSEYQDGEGFPGVRVVMSSYGSSGTRVRFHYDGCGFKIKNMYQNKPTSQYTGLFIIGWVVGERTESQVYIKNVSVINANVNGKNACALLSCPPDYYHSSYTTLQKYFIENCFVSGTLTSLIGEKTMGENTGMIGATTMDSSNLNSGKSYSSLMFDVKNCVAVLDVNISVSSQAVNKTLNLGLLCPGRDSVYHKNFEFTGANNCVHATISIDNNVDNSVVNISGIIPTYSKIDSSTSYTNLEMNNIRNKNNVNLFYFTNDVAYETSMISNHDKGQSNIYNYDNVHYLTDEQMKDLTYYKNLGWTIYE